MTIQEKADDIINRCTVSKYHFYSIALDNAIITIKYSIENLNIVKNKMEYTEHIKPLIAEIKEQTLLLNELKSRLGKYE